MQMENKKKKAEEKKYLNNEILSMKVFREEAHKWIDHFASALILFRNSIAAFSRLSHWCYQQLNKLIRCNHFIRGKPFVNVNSIAI